MKMARVVATDGIEPRALQYLESLGHEILTISYSEDELLAGVLSDFDAIIIRSATRLNADVIAASTGLKVIGRAGVGVDNIDLDAATSHGITVVNAPRASTHSVVELTIAHLLASVRNLAASDRSLRSGKWEKKAMRGSELSGKALGLIGFGRIAQGVATVASAIGMECHAYDPYLPENLAEQLDVMIHQDVDDLFRTCTHLSIHCDLSAETRHLVNAERISLMPGIGADGVACGNHIVNCARGGILDENAALAALESGELSSLALDVFEHEPVSPNNPLLQHPRFHGTPHIGAATNEAQLRVGMKIADAIDAVLSGDDVATKVN